MSAIPAAVSPPAPATVQVALLSVASDAGVVLAQERGHFREQQLDVQVLPFGSTPEMLGALAAGQVDVGGASTSPGFLNAFARGVKIRIVADKGNSSTGAGLAAVLVRRALWDSGEVRSATDLRGRKIAMPSAGSTAETSLDRALRPAGLRARDTEFVLLSFPDMPAAMASGAVDAAVAIEPVITRMEASGSGAVWKREDDYYPNHQNAVLYYSDAFATDRADAARRFMVAYLQGIRDYNDAFFKGTPQARAEAVAALVKHTTVKDPALYDHMAMPGLRPDGELDLGSLREDYEYWLETGYQEERLTIDDIVDSEFIRFAQQQLGPYR